MRSLPSSSPAASVMTPAKCGSSPSTLIPHWHDKHPLTCDNDKMDSWTDGWPRQPPVYSGVLLFLKRNTPIMRGTMRIVTIRRAGRTGLVTVTKYGTDPLIWPHLLF